MISIRSYNNIITAAVSKTLAGSFSVEIGEWLALREGLLLAQKLNLSISVAETDARQVVDAL